MAKIIQIIDVDSDGHRVRLDDGRVVHMLHGGQHPEIGQEFTEAEKLPAPFLGENSGVDELGRTFEERQKEAAALHAEQLPDCSGDPPPPPQPTETESKTGA